MPLYGDFKLVVPLFPNGPLKLFGKPYHEDGSAKDWSLITLDERLKSTHTARGIKPMSFSLGEPDVFELLDGSFALFGATIPDRNRGTVSRIAVVSSDLKQERFLDPPQSPLTDHALLGAAVPTGKPGEFAVVKTLQDREREIADPSARMGMALDFIEIR